MNVYAGSGGGPRRPRKKRRTWVRVAFWSAGVLLLALVITGGVAAWWIHRDLAAVSHLTPGAKKAETVLGRQEKGISVANQPATALLIGSDHRSTDGTAPSRSDTLILVRIDPRTGLISVFSIPRDLWVPIPGFPDNRINAAYSEGGEKLAVQTVTALTGVKPNYLVEVNFAGFESIVNDIGGIYLPIDQNYQHTNVPGEIGDYKSVHINPGYQALGGSEALNFARYRHTDSDLYRNARQQTFLRQFQTAASNKFHGISVSDIPDIVRVINDITKNAQITGTGGTPSIFTLRQYAALAFKLKGHVVTARLEDTQPADIGGASVLTDSTADIHRAVYQFLHPQTVKPPTAGLPKQAKPHSKKFKPQVKPSTVKILALNGTDRPKLAARAAAGFEAWTYRARSANAPTTGYKRTWVYYQPGFEKAAADAIKVLGAGYGLPVPTRFVARKADVIVILGKDFSGTPALTPPKAPVSKLPADMVATQDYQAAFRTAAHHAHLPGLYPTAVYATGEQCADQAYPSYQPNGFCEFSAAQPIRVYHITASSAGPGLNSIYAYYEVTDGGFWGIEETHFAGAPILQNPNATRTINGRAWQFYYDGSHIHMIATVDNVHHVAYWVQNTLLDELSNADMIAIAGSLEPTG